MAELTPYDTGARLEPELWVPYPRRSTNHEDDYGKVDFDDDESATVATLHIERNGALRSGSGPRYILVVDRLAEPVIVHGPGGEYLGTLRP